MPGKKFMIRKTAQEILAEQIAAQQETLHAIQQQQQEIQQTLARKRALAKAAPEPVVVEKEKIDDDVVFIPRADVRGNAEIKLKTKSETLDGETVERAKRSHGK